jgi:polyisoprenoid-binding protein YceI
LAARRFIVARRRLDLFTGVETDPENPSGVMMRNIWQHTIPGVLALVAYSIMMSVPVAPKAAAMGVDWVVVPEQSRVLFDYLSNGQPAGGEFFRFEGSGMFDLDAPGDATLELRIKSTSIDLGNNLASAFATSAEWFDSANFPNVVYRLTALTPVGGNDFLALGELMIRGRTRPIETTINLEIGPDNAHVTGTLKLDRKDYRLGVGPSAMFVDIGSAVAVRFELTARPVR